MVVDEPSFVPNKSGVDEGIPIERPEIIASDPHGSI